MKTAPYAFAATLSLFGSLFGCLLGIAGLVSAAPNTNDVSQISVASGALAPNADSYQGSIATGGNLAVFLSNATNITAHSVSSAQAYLRNRSASSTTLLSKINATAANGAVSSAKIAASGDYAVLTTAATNLTGNPSALSSVYRVALSDGGLTLISNTVALKSSTANNITPDISDDGQTVLFLTNTPVGLCSGTSNIAVNSSGTFSCVSYPTPFSSYPLAEARLSGNGSTVAAVVTDTSGNKQGYIIPVGDPTTLARVTELSGTPGNGDSTELSLSSAGTRMVFSSTSNNLTSPSRSRSDKAIYLYDSGATPQIRLISKNTDGDSCNGVSSAPAISPNGAYIAFLSTCRDIVTSGNPPTSGVRQAFVYSVSGDSFTRVGLKTTGDAINGDVDGSLAVDNSGQFVLFATATNNVSPRPRDVNNTSDIFLLDTGCGSNSDGTGSDDCTDVCPYDASKESSEGSCGCGFSDADSDSDGTADCEDLCPEDPLKTTSYGICGCGTSDADADSNGQADCLDPTSSFKPSRARFIPDGARRSGTIVFPRTFAAGSVTYEFQFNRNGRVIRTGTTLLRTVRVRRIGLGRFIFRYRVINGSTVSRWSDKVQVRLSAR